jgi:hypothetical protein
MKRLILSAGALALPLLAAASLAADAPALDETGRMSYALASSSAATSLAPR